MGRCAAKLLQIELVVPVPVLTFHACIADIGGTSYLEQLLYKQARVAGARLEV